jgi:hypothetical protein
MAEQIDNIKEISDLSVEDKQEAWYNWVRSEVNSVLDIYLPESNSGHINIKYHPHIVERLETGPVYDNSKASGVTISIAFGFDKSIDLTKPRIDDTL